MHKEGGSIFPLADAKALPLRHEALPAPQAPSASPGAAVGHAPANLWKLTAAKDAGGKPVIQLEYRVAGLPRFVYPKDQPHVDANGKRVYAVLSVLLAGFDANRSLAVNRKVGLPVMAAPTGDEAAPVLSGKVSLDLESLIRLKPTPAEAAHGQAGHRTLSLWAMALDQRAEAEVVW